MNSFDSVESFIDNLKKGEKMKKMLSSVALLAITSNVLMAGGDIVPVEPVVPEVVVSDEWKYTVIVYLWAAGMEGTTTDGDDLDIGFSDLMDHVDLAFLGVIGAQKGKWGFLSDISYMNLSKDVNVPLPGGDAITSIEMKTWVVAPMVTYRVMESEQLSLDILGGVRYLYMKSPIEVNYSSVGLDSDSIWDGIVGVKGKYDLNEKWFMPFKLDVGTGESDVTWEAYAGVGYKYENFDLMVGYRHIDWDFDDNDPAAGLLTDLTNSGPVIGAKFNF